MATSIPNIIVSNEDAWWWTPENKDRLDKLEQAFIDYYSHTIDIALSN